MMPFILHPEIIKRVAEIEKAGGDCADMDWIALRLRYGREIPDRFNDHALEGKLRGLRSVIIGHDSDGRTVVMVYQILNRRVMVAIVDEHDRAYRLLAVERSGRR